MSESHSIARHFCSALNTNLLAGMLCGLFSVKRKLFGLSSVLFFGFGGDSYSSGGKPLKMFLFVSKITVRVFA
jgi:hypothetical protein